MEKIEEKVEKKKVEREWLLESRQIKYLVKIDREIRAKIERQMERK